jgi:hypothetical protein
MKQASLGDVASWPSSNGSQCPKAFNPATACGHCEWHIVAVRHAFLTGQCACKHVDSFAYRANEFLPRDQERIPGCTAVHSWPEI